ncbi:hypothetical protein, partial [Salinicola salarius]|uniref:hypothetical protein n=1 Tax=Salinicola salarius TaxID=430457 RepID=UPI0026EA264B
AGGIVQPAQGRAHATVSAQDPGGERRLIDARRRRDQRDEGGLENLGALMAENRRERFFDAA